MKQPTRAALLSIAAFVATTALAALKAGDAAPPFTAPASLAGKPFTYSLKESLAKGPVVVYFYPSAFTSGCNVQAHEFATRIEQFAAVGASVVGVSLDSIERLNAFSADPALLRRQARRGLRCRRHIARSFGLRVTDAQPGATDTRGKEIDHGFAERTTFVVRKDGTIAAIVGGVSPSENVARALEQVKKLAASR